MHWVTSYHPIRSDDLQLLIMKEEVVCVCVCVRGVQDQGQIHLDKYVYLRRIEKGKVFCVPPKATLLT